jgi:uncharacterized protein (DUF1330 family)
MADPFEFIADPDVAAVLRDFDLSRPVGALNQLKFRRHAAYEPDCGETPCTGEEAYSRYAAAVTPILAAMGAEVILSGLVWLTGRLEEWDRNFVVRYPKASMLLELPSNSDYQKIAHHRSAALAESRLLIMDFTPSGLS